jgi:multidrug efflux pump subunit AcrA (membrane-fusion protein)
LNQAVQKNQLSVGDLPDTVVEREFWKIGGGEIASRPIFWTALLQHEGYKIVEEYFKKMYKTKILFLQNLFLLATFLAACSGSSGKSSATPTPLPPIVSYEKAIFTVEKGPITSTKDVLGVVVPSRQEELFFRSSGYATRILVKDGDLVKEGDLLAELQVDDLLKQLEQAKIDLEVAQANLDKTEVSRKYSIQRAEIDVAMWEKRVELAQLETNYVYSTLERTRAETNLFMAEQNLALAKLSLEQAQEQISPYEQQAVQRSQLAVERLEDQIAERQIVAPFDGMVIRTSLRPGQSVEAYNVVVTIGDPTQLVIRSQYDYDLNTILNINTEVKLYLSTERTQEYAITYLPNFIPITNANTGTDLFSTDWFYFNTPPELGSDEIKVGKSVYLTIVLGKKDDALLLAPAAIRSFGDNNFVIVLEGDRRRRVEISEIGLKTTDKWEVIADLQEGDQILGP